MARELNREELERMIQEAYARLWTVDCPPTLSIEQVTGWNNALVAFKLRLLRRIWDACA